MSVVDLTKPYDYEQMLQDVEELQKRHPSLMGVRTIGRSVDGRDIPSFTIGNNKRKILLTAGVHGRESVNPAVLMGMAEHHLENYTRTPAFRHLSLALVPMVNPDGHEVALYGFAAIRENGRRLLAKEKGIPHQEWKYNANGIDLNRNFPSRTWSRASGTMEPASEPETRALMGFLSQDGSIAFLDYHSRGELIYYHRARMGREYNERQRALARELARVTTYRLADPSEEVETGDVGGNTVHFYSERTGKPAITIETLPDETGFPPPFKRQRELAGKLRDTPFVLANACNITGIGI